MTDIGERIAQAIEAERNEHHAPSEWITLDHAARIAREFKPAETVTEAVAKIETHNGTPVTAENLRWAATHGVLTTSWVFDVLQGLADALTEDGAE